MANTHTLRALARTYTETLAKYGVKLEGNPSQSWNDAIAAFDDGDVLADLINMWDRGTTRFEFNAEGAKAEPNLSAAFNAASLLSRQRWQGLIDGKINCHTRTVAEFAAALRCSPLKLVRPVDPLSLAITYQDDHVIVEWSGAGAVRDSHEQPSTPLGWVRRLLDVPVILACVGAAIGGGRAVWSRLENGHTHLSSTRQTRLEMLFELEPGTLSSMERTRKACKEKLAKLNGRSRVRLPRNTAFRASLTPFGLQFESPDLLASEDSEPDVPAVTRGVQAAAGRRAVATGAR